jgi:hypothetical protein
MCCVQNDAPHNSSVVARLFVATVLFFTEALPSNDKGINMQIEKIKKEIM